VVGSVGEQKTKPTQASVRDLRGLGLSPDIMACRSTAPLEPSIKEKIAMFCQVPPELVLSVHDCSSVYEVPLLLHKQGLSDFLVSRLGLTRPTEPLPFFSKWTEIARIEAGSSAAVTVALVGKYTNLQDSYCSVTKSLTHAALHLGYKVTVNWIEATDLEEPGVGPEGPSAEVQAEAWRLLRSSDCVLVPGGFGGRGQDGKLSACKYARESKVPFLGICLGFQMGVIEYCRNVLGMEGANSTEIDAGCAHPVVMFMPEGSTTHLGGTMRLGSRRTLFVDPTGKSQTHSLYEEMGRLLPQGETGAVPQTDERHRHRYEVNPDYVSRIEQGGLPFVGKDETNTRMEVFELPQTEHPCYVGVQYHPEMKSRPLNPSPVFVGLLRAAIERKGKK
jgi:CTP synthase